MNDTLAYIIDALVDNKEAVSIEEKQEEGKLILVIHADQTDIGKIIGKQGRIIRAIRDIIKIIAVKQNVYVDIVIAEE